MAPLAGLAAIDVNLTGGSLTAGAFVTESTFGGVVVYAMDLFHAFRDGLDELQRAELPAAAMEAGVNLRRFFDGGQPGLQVG